MPELAVGQTVGDYEILGVLGAGGMGQVFRVRNVISHRQEAMKVMLPGFAANAEALDRFLREIQVQASLVHPNIATVHTAVRAGEWILMILELIEGESLRDRLLAGPLPVAAAVNCIDQVLSALAFAHSKGVIHRDVKPANVLITPEGAVKLTDFGIARGTGHREITGTGRAVGSLYYMSPEQIRAVPVDHRSDLYSAGVTLYEALTGVHPIEGDGEYEIMQAHLLRTPAAPDVVAPHISPALSAVVLKALEKKPDQRFSSALEFQAAIRAAPSAGSPAPSQTGQRPARPELARLQALLARNLGPIARNIVDTAARRFSDPEQVCRAVAEHVPEGPERDAFLRACRSDPTLTPMPASAPTAIDSAAITAARESLVRYLGPIAGMLVERTARRARTLDEFHDALAAQLPEGEERKAFLKKLGRGKSQ